MKNLIKTALLTFCMAVICGTSVVRAETDLGWMAEYFPSLSDKNTVALWLFDETHYSLNTLTDAGIYEYDLRLFDATLADGKFGTALKTVPGPSYNLYYAEWCGKVCKVRMRRPKGEPSGLWGPTIAPEKLLGAFNGPKWTLEFWFKCVSRPDTAAVLLDMGQAYEDGIKITLNPAGKEIRFENIYAGFIGYFPTDVAKLCDGKWRHVAFTRSGDSGKLKHYVDGKLQAAPNVLALAGAKAVPETVIPSSFVRPDGYEVFDKTANVIKYRLHRFNLSMGEDRYAVQDIDAMFDEFRVSDVVRYTGEFTPPKTFSRNYGSDAPKEAKADGGPLLFAPDSPKGTVKLGSRKYMFIDGAILDSQENVKFVCNPPRDRTELNFWPEKSAWRPSVVDVDGKVHLYAPESYGSDRGNTHLRISEDGLNFTKPNMGLYEYEGSTNNDFVISLRPLYGTFFKDLRPGIAAEEKYKMTAWLSNRGVYLYISPDGMHWRKNETAMLPILSGGDAETYWDDQRGLYCTWLRRDTGHYTKENPGHGRAEVYFETDDVTKTWPFKKLKEPYFHTFSLPCPTGEGPTYFKENKTGQVYRSRAIKYPWAPDTYVSFPWRFKEDDETRRVDLGVSRDGINWQFFAHEQWYAEPPEGSEEVVSMYGLIRRGDDIWQYIDEGGAHGDTKGRDKPRVYARVVQRLDGFVSLDAGKTSGMFVTRPIVFDGSKLVLNVAAAGKVLVEIQDGKGKVIKGFSIADCKGVQIDAIRHVVSWKGGSDLSKLSGKKVRLKFKMENAKLYAMQFTQ